MEETYRHGAGIESGDLGANVSSHSLSQVYRRILLAQLIGTDDGCPGRRPGARRISGWGIRWTFDCICLGVSARQGRASSALPWRSGCSRFLSVRASGVLDALHGGGWPSASALHCCRLPPAWERYRQPASVVGAVALAVVAAVGLRVAAGQLPDFTLIAAVAFTAILVGLDIDAPRSASARTIDVADPGTIGAGARRGRRCDRDLRRALADHRPGVIGGRVARGRRRRHGRHQAARRRRRPSAASPGSIPRRGVATCTRPSVASSASLAT